jgi:hypothetical protein
MMRAKNRNFQVLLLLLTLVLTRCTERFPEHPNYKLSAKQTGYMEHKGEHVFSISLELTSKSDSLPPFYLMTCSWYNNSLSSIKEIRIGHYLCDANYMDIVRLDSDQYLDMKTVAGTKGEFPVNDFRIGLIIVDTTELSYQRYWTTMDESWEDELKQLQEDRRRIVWSNVIELEKSEDTLRHAWPYWELKNKASNKR